MPVVGRDSAPFPMSSVKTLDSPAGDVNVAFRICVSAGNFPENSSERVLAFKFLYEGVEVSFSRSCSHVLISAGYVLVNSLFSVRLISKVAVSAIDLSLIHI